MEWLSSIDKKDGGEEREGRARLPSAVPHVVRHKTKATKDEETRSSRKCVANDAKAIFALARKRLDLIQYAHL